MHPLESYVGRIVRLKQQALQAAVKRGRSRLLPPDNCFLVAAVSRELRQLICYGAHLRVAVGVGDVVLI
jgi:hypothetical protein